MSKPLSKAAAPSINVTPLIDVLLVLLIIFMVIQPQKEMKLPVRAPQPATDAQPATGILMLTVSESARLELNTHPISLDELGLKLSTLMGERATDDRALFIKAASSLPYPFIVRLIDMAKKSGVISVGLLADEEKIPEATRSS
ncbi:MAG: biopolymer transporter ExbD [Acidobacteriota bacterium]